MDNDISIVLAVYNGEKYIHRLMDSLLAQVDVTIREIIVVDDVSTDDSAAIISSYQQKHPHISLLRNGANAGPIASFIKGATAATSAYIAFADQDDIWAADKLSLSLGLMQKIDTGAEPCVVFSDLEMINENDEKLHDSFWNLYAIKPAENNFFTILFGNIATGCTMLINRPMLAEFISMPLDAAMHDHWIALIAASFGKWGYLDERTVLYRVHSKSVTDKSKVTIVKSAMNFLDASFNRNSAFLAEHMQQAVLFKQRYAGKLDKRMNAQLDYFTGLKNAPGMIKKVNSKLRFKLNKWLKF